MSKKASKITFAAKFGKNASSRIKVSAVTHFCLIFGSLFESLGEVFFSRNSFWGPPKSLGKSGVMDVDRSGSPWMPAEQIWVET